MKGICQTFQKGLTYLAFAGSIVALSRCDTPEVKVLYQTLPEAAAGCSVKLENRVKMGGSDQCRLEVAGAGGKTLLVLNKHCGDIDGLEIYDPSGKSYTLETVILDDHYLMESKPVEK